jgi:hypothetical protein
MKKRNREVTTFTATSCCIKIENTNGKNRELGYKATNNIMQGKSSFD